jgi:Bacterial capsule synthesis protein PGA_cap
VVAEDTQCDKPRPEGRAIFLIMKKLPAVTAYTPEGKVLVAILRGLLRLVHLFMGKKWAVPPRFFHDDPRHYTVTDVLFFAYKYYFKSPKIDTHQGIIGEEYASNHVSAEGVGLYLTHNPPIFSTANIGKNATIERSVTLSVAGDLMPYEWIQPQFCPHLWDDIGDDFFSSDITFANLETPIDAAKPPSLVPEVMLTDMLFNGDETMFSIFNADNFASKTTARIGFDILGTANNHSLDMAEAGVYSTIDFLEKKNIQHLGTAKTREEREKTVIIERNGIRLAFVSYTFSMNQKVNPADKPWLVNHLEVNQPNVDLSVLTQDIAKAKQQNADLVILSLHYGNAYQAYPCPHIVNNTKRIFEECGADIILGGHAHNVQPMAAYPFTCPHTGVEKRGFVIFSLGDFVAYDIFNWCHLPVYLKLEIGLVSGDSLSVIENSPSDKSLRDTKQPIPILSFSRNTEEGGRRAILTKVEAIPVYVCGNYRSRNDRDLRFLDARKTLELIEANKTPPFMTAWNVRELRELMQFYNNFFAKNLVPPTQNDLQVVQSHVK